MRALSLLEEREERLRHQIVGNNETNTLHPIVLTERIRSLQKNIDTVAALVPNFNACAQECTYLSLCIDTFSRVAICRRPQCECMDISKHSTQATEKRAEQSVGSCSHFAI